MSAVLYVYLPQISAALRNQSAHNLWKFLWRMQGNLFQHYFNKNEKWLQTKYDYPANGKGFPFFFNKNLSTRYKVNYSFELWLKK